MSGFIYRVNESWVFLNFKMILQINKCRVNSQLPLEIVSFVNYFPEINKTSITS